MNGTQQELFNAELVREHRWDWCMLKAIASTNDGTFGEPYSSSRFATRGHADESIAQAVTNHLNTSALGQGKFYCIKAILLRKVVRPEPSTLQRVEFATESTGIGTGFTPCMFEVEID